MKRLLLLIFLMLSGIFLQAQGSGRFQLSSHILDITEGKPAIGVVIKLEKYNKVSGKWNFITKKTTDANGRVTDFLHYKGNSDNLGIYRLRFVVDHYFKNKNKESFYPFIEVTFQIRDQDHYHVPITLAEFGYSTYRGS